MNRMLKAVFPMLIACAGLFTAPMAHAQPEPGTQAETGGSATTTTAATGGGWVLLDATATSLVRSGTNAMYNLRYAEADSIFNDLVRQYPDHPAGYFLLALVDWWRIVPNSSVDSKVGRYSESFNKRIDKVVEISNQKLAKNSNDIVGLFFKGSALGYRARLMTLRSFSGTSLLDWARAASEGYEAYQIILQCQRLAPSNSDILLGSGLYNYLGAYLPEKYPAAKGAIGFLPPGDRKIGLSMLRISGERAVYASTEARYSLLDILTNMEADYVSALPVARALHEQYPGNSVFYRFLARVLYQTSNFAEADTAFRDILRKIKLREPGYELTLARQALYYLGDIRLRSGDYETAVRLFQEADQQSRRLGDDDESSWVILANLKMGYAFDLMGRRDEAVRQYKRVLSMDNYNGSRDNAQKFIAQPYK